MPHTASGNPSIGYSMPCPASFFDAISGVKKLTNFMHSITYQTSAYKPSAVILTEEKEVLIMAQSLNRVSEISFELSVLSIFESSVLSVCEVLREFIQCKFKKK